MRERLAVAIRDVEARGYEVVVGHCMDGAGHVSAPAADRASELMSMLTDPGIRAVVPPWGGEMAIDLLPCSTGTGCETPSRPGSSGSPTCRPS